MKKVLIFFSLFFFITNISAKPITIFFFNPDAAPTNPSLLIKYSNKYFKKNNYNIKIQPIISPQIIKNLINKKTADFFIVQEDLLDELKNKYHKILIPLNKNNKPLFRKQILCKNIKKLENLKNKIIGSTSIGNKSLDFLDKYIFKPNRFNIKDVKCIWVKKDLDAILATKFGQIQAAIISNKNYKKLKKINPNVLKGLHKITESIDIPETPLYVFTSKKTKKIKIITDSFLNMNKSKEGKLLLDLLGYSKWKKIGE